MPDTKLYSSGRKKGNGMKKSIWKQLDWCTTILPLAGVIGLSVLFMVIPEQSTLILNTIRAFLGNELGIYYILIGIASLLTTGYMAFSRFGRIRLGKEERTEYSNFQWGTMIFTSTMAADILFYSCIEWTLYANEPHITELGGIQTWASTYPLFHWGPVAWSFYIVLAVAFGFMLHVRGRNKQKFSEACRPFLGRRVDGFLGKIIDLIAIFALLAGTATTFSLATPLLADALAHVINKPSSITLSISVLILIAMVYTITVLLGMTGISRLASICAYLFFGLLGYVLFAGGEAVYILETGVTAVGNMVQNFVGMATWMDPLRENGFPQNWTIYYWAYWMVWCVATPFFIGKISKGRTIKNVVLGGYGWGIAGTYVSFIILGNYGLAQQMRHGMDLSGNLVGTNSMYTVIVQIFDTLPLPLLALLLLVITMIAFYSTTFDALTMVISTYSYKELSLDKEPDKKVRTFWAILFIVFPIALIFSENSLNSLQSVSMIAAFPVGAIIILIVISFFLDATKYLTEEQKKRACWKNQ